MKTLLIFFSLVTIQEGISQDLDSALAFYPLHLGDTWTYDCRKGENPSVHLWYSTLSVVGDTTIWNGTTYTLLSAPGATDSSYLYVRVDSSTGCVYWLVNLQTGTEYVSDSLRAQKGDHSGPDLCWDVYPDTVLGFPTVVKYFLHNPFWSHALAYGLGMTYQYDGNSVYGVIETILVYARIAGREFGTPVSVATHKTQPVALTLSQNYPNPFNPSTNIPYSVDRLAFVSIEVFNQLGQHVRTLVFAIKNPGQYIANFNAGHLCSGIYYYVLDVNGRRITKSMILLK
jgi:hypothetical protein